MVSDVKIDPEKAAARVALDRREVETCRAIADAAQEFADEKHRELLTRERQQREMLRVLAEHGWTPDDSGRTDW